MCLIVPIVVSSWDKGWTRHLCLLGECYLLPPCGLSRIEQQGGWPCGLFLHNPRGPWSPASTSGLSQPPAVHKSDLIALFIPCILKAAPMGLGRQSKRRPFIFSKVLFLHIHTPHHHHPWPESNHVCRGSGDECFGFSSTLFLQ